MNQKTPVLTRVTSRKTLSTQDIALPELSETSESKVEQALGHAMMARLYLNQGRLNEAEQLYLLALKQQESFFGANHPEVMPFLSDLACFYVNCARYLDARFYLERLFAMKLQMKGYLSSADNLWQLFDVVEMLFTVLTKLGLASEGEKVYLAVFRALEKEHGTNHKDTLCALELLGGYYMRTGVYVAARAVLEELLEKRTRLLGGDSLELSSTLSKLAQVYDKLHLTYDQVAVLEHQVQLIDIAHGGVGLSLASQLVRLGEALSQASATYQCHDFAERARLIFCRALSLYEKCGEVNSNVVQNLRLKIKNIA